MLRANYEADVAVPRLFEFGEGDRTVPEGRIGEHSTVFRHDAAEYHEVIVAFEIDGYDERRQFL
jgi:hypothetical protein